METPGTREKLNSERAVTDWRSLGPHHEREALFLVTGEVDLVDAAVAIAEDDSAAIAAWLAQGALARPTDDEIAAWSDAPDARFEFLIVQPFVVAARVRS
jgi:hypothetical protein